MCCFFSFVEDWWKGEFESYPAVLRPFFWLCSEITSGDHICARDQGSHQGLLHTALSTVLSLWTQAAIICSVTMITWLNRNKCETPILDYWLYVQKWEEGRKRSNLGCWVGSSVTHWGRESRELRRWDFKGGALQWVWDWIDEFKFLWGWSRSWDWSVGIQSWRQA